MKLNDTVYKKIHCTKPRNPPCFDKSFLPSDHALMIPKTSDGRVLFAVPWHDKIVVGTTDTLIKSLEPIALEKEIEFVLENCAKILGEKPTRADVLSVLLDSDLLQHQKKKEKHERSF
jgi:glycerol-3-phosphate dehydrogenase